MGREAGYFKPNDPRRGPGGRRVMPPELRNALDAATPAAVKLLHDTVNDEAARLSDRIRAAEVILDRAFGKPTQAVEMEADIQTHADPLEGMSLSQRKKALDEALKAYSKGIVDKPRK